MTMRIGADMLPPYPSRAGVVPVAPRPAPSAGSSGDAELLRQTVEELRSQVKQQQQEIEEISAGLRRIEDEFQDLRRALGG